MALPPENYFKIGPYLGVFQGAHTALNINEGIIKVVGPEGAGKSSFCNKLVEELQAQGQEIVYFETPPESSDYLYEFIQSALGLDKGKNFNRALTRYLQETSAKHKLVIIYNDAEKISKDLFILIRLLNNIHDHSSTLVSQIIVGTEQLDELLDDPALRSLTQYLNQSFTLAPMSRIDLDDFYSSYKNAYGISGKDMSNKELTDLFLRSKGLPGKAAEILDNFFRAEELSQDSAISVLNNAETPGQIGHNNDALEAVDKPAVEVDRKTESRPAPLSGTQSETDLEFLENLSLLPETVPAGETVAASSALDGADRSEKAANKTAEQQEEQVELKEHVELKEQKEQKEQNQKLPPVSAAEADTFPDVLLPPLGKSATTEPPVVSKRHDQELDEILHSAATAPIDRGGLYFKAALSVVIVISSMILAFVLSGESDSANKKVAEMLAPDSPLYLDEVSDDSTGNFVAGSTSGSPTPEPVIYSTANPANEEPSLVIGAVKEISTPLITMVDNEATDNSMVEKSLPDNVTESLSNAAESGSLTSAESQEMLPQELSVDKPEPEAVNASAEPVIAQTTIITADVVTSEAEEDFYLAINAAINDWLLAWKEGRYDDYLATYHSEFIPSYHESYELWQEQRRSRVQGVSGISLNFDRLDYIDLSETESTVELWLQYARGSYADETHKQLVFKLDGDSWLIVLERNIEVIRLK